jgi:hypothetical protein
MAGIHREEFARSQYQMGSTAKGLANSESRASVSETITGALTSPLSPRSDPLNGAPKNPSPKANP